MLDKKINLSLIGAILVQTFFFGWFASSINSRVTSLEQAALGTGALSARVAGVEGKVDMINSGVNDIKQTIAAITVVQVRPAAGKP